MPDTLLTHEHLGPHAVSTLGPHAVSTLGLAHLILEARSLHQLGYKVQRLDQDGYGHCLSSLKYEWHHRFHCFQEIQSVVHDVDRKLVCVLIPQKILKCIVVALACELSRVDGVKGGQAVYMTTVVKLRNTIQSQKTA